MGNDQDQGVLGDMSQVVFKIRRVRLDLLNIREIFLDLLADPRRGLQAPTRLALLPIHFEATDTLFLFTGDTLFSRGHAFSHTIDNHGIHLEFLDRNLLCLDLIDCQIDLVPTGIAYHMLTRKGRLGHIILANGIAKFLILRRIPILLLQSLPVQEAARILSVRHFILRVASFLYYIHHFFKP